MNLRLKAAIIESGKKCFQVAKNLDWHPSKVSRIINETYIPTDEEKEAMARVIGVPATEIFPETISPLVA